MICEKTGCDVYIVPYGVWAHGDAHKLDNGTYIFRLSCPSLEPIYNRLHYTIHSLEHWFDRHNTYSTLIAVDVTYHGYAGVREPEAHA